VPSGSPARYGTINYELWDHTHIWDVVLAFSCDSSGKEDKWKVDDWVWRVLEEYRKRWLELKALEQKRLSDGVDKNDREMAWGKEIESLTHEERGYRLENPNEYARFEAYLIRQSEMSCCMTPLEQERRIHETLNSTREVILDWFQDTDFDVDVYVRDAILSFIDNPDSFLSILNQNQM